VSLKENVDAIKNELSQEEKLFENAVRLERFYKKYKLPIIGAISALVLFIVGMTGFNYYNAIQQEKANSAYTTLKQTPNDKEALTQLQATSPTLYKLFLFDQAIKSEDLAQLTTLKDDNLLILADMAQYNMANLEESDTKIDTYALSEQALLKDFALLSSATALLKRGEVQMAHSKLSQIPLDSPLNEYASLLRHYGITNEKN
jgi:hypothetical protein